MFLCGRFFFWCFILLHMLFLVVIILFRVCIIHLRLFLLRIVVIFGFLMSILLSYRSSYCVSKSLHSSGDLFVCCYLLFLLVLFMFLYVFVPRVVSLFFLRAFVLRVCVFFFFVFCSSLFFFFFFQIFSFLFLLLLLSSSFSLRICLSSVFVVFFSF